MRPFAVTVALFAAALALPAPAAAFDRAQWSFGQASTGTWYLRCRAAACGGDSIASYRVQKPRLYASLEAYAQSRPARVTTLREVLGSIMSDGKPNRRRHGAYTEYWVESSVVSRQGGHEAYISGVLVGDRLSYTIVSSAHDADRARRHYRELSDALAAGRPPLDDAI
ncbi:hypothetical protein EYW49_09675 [Siculibacillus lacustris]|uniref:Uncharacterized protein n=1 Tax=Siculibacillus lacustris TaxID=1549641 RepID=A0A4Q9VQU4_9HYPH|nr:hypothetical protein [Siculibacillus lacustris]TBW38210.1 hypothetical protein EYW49_09675 [Siculibacillus lacustris]